jgi:hypothetical protein
MYLFQILPILIIFLIGVNLEIVDFFKEIFFPQNDEKFENLSSLYPKLEKLEKQNCLNHFFDMQIMSLE